MEKSTKDAWDKLQAISLLLTSILIPLVVLVVGIAHNNTLKNSENKVKYLELALSILRTEKTGQNEVLHKWAAELLAANSPTPMPSDVQKQLLNSASIFLSSYGGQEVDLGSYIECTKSEKSIGRKN